jgi:hypothetical protein
MRKYDILNFEIVSLGEEILALNDAKAKAEKRKAELEAMIAGLSTVMSSR